MARSPTSFKPGKSGNPGGKPPGKTARGRFRDMVNDALPEIIESLVTAAKAGDVQAARIILDKTVPSIRPTADPVSFPVPTGDNLADKGMRVLTATTTGKLDTDSARAIMDILTAQAKLTEQTEIMQRLESIETWLNQRNAAP